MRDRKGFTLIEIIAVVIIIGVLALIVVPSVSSYIFSSRKTAYNAHEKSMEEAAKSMTVEVINGKDNYALPRRGNFSSVTLKELVNKELIKGLQDPQTGEKCNDELSYVIIKAVDDDSYDYQACLYCGSYVTESDECDGTGIDDSTPPVCGTITGDSSEWTNKSRTITVGCSDPDSGCKRSKYSQTFNSTMESSEISIYNNANMETKCPVPVKVDKTKPTCELEIVGDDNVESTGWTSGRTVVVKLKAYSDGENQSGVATYGMGTSSKKPNYNALTSYEILNVSGTTTVFGYVKDNAGNEGMCYKTVTTGLEKPVFVPRYGYQIYPEKERFSTSNVSITASNKLKTTSTNPTITFNHMDKYKNVTAVIVDLSTEISDPASWKLTTGGSTYTADAESTTRLRFNIETEPNLKNISSSSTYTIKLGNVNNKEYTINRIEIEQIEGNIKAKHEVAVNLITRKQVVRTTQWSWDNGAHWDNKYYARFDVRNNAKSGIAKIKNDIPLESNGVAYSVVKGDGIIPSIDLSSGNTNWTNQDITLTAKVKDNETGLIGYMWSPNGNLDYYNSGWQYYDTPTTSEKTFDYTVSKNGTYYFYAKDEAGNVNVKSIPVTNIDKLKPTCTAITGQATLSCYDAVSTTDYGQSLISKYYFDTESNPAVSKFKEVKPATANFSKNETATKGNGTRYYVFVIDQAGNRSDPINDLYYTVTYDGNTGTTPTKTSDIRRKTTEADLTPKSTKTGYTFLGWNTDKKATEKLDSYTVNSNVTLYATWSLNKPTNVTITGAAEKIYGSATTTLTCTQDREYASDVTLYYSFGYATSDGGARGNWTDASTSNKLTIGKTEYYGDRYYSCRVYAKNSYLTSGTTTSSKDINQLVRYNNATITFKGNTGTVNGTSPVYVRTGESGAFTGIRNNTAATLPTASKSCYTFNGWYTAASGGSKVLKDNNAFTGTAVSGYTTKTAWATVVDRNLYAQYIAHTYSLSYDLDKGTHGTSHPGTATYDTAFTVNNPSKSVTVSFDLNDTGATATTTDITKSYTFSGWNITDMDTVTHYYDSKTTKSTSISSTTATSYKNLLCNDGTVKFLALWTPPEITLPTVTKTGYTCKWTSGTYSWVSGGKYTPQASGGATSRTMKASCTPNVYTITLDKQSGSGGTNKIYEKYDTGWYSDSSASTSISEITAPTRTGYTYDGYYTSTGGSGTKIIGSNKKIAGANNTFTSDSTIYAKWNPITYTVSYSLDKGTHGTSHPTSGTYDTSFTVDNPTKSITVSFDLNGTGATATTTDITKSYTFSGWSITGMDTDTHYYGSSTTKDTSIDSTKAKSYKNLRSTSGTVTFSASWAPPDVKLPKITKTGYTCKWTSGSYEWVSGGTYTPAESGGATSRTMKASCTPNPYTITYKANGGTGSDQTQDVTYDSTWKTKSSIFSKTGYIMDGWATKSDGSATYSLNATQGAYTGTPDKLYAHWKPREFTISYYPNGGSGSVVTKTVKYNTNWSTLGAIFTKDGYDLKGWATTSSGNVSYNLSTSQGTFTGTSNISLYAKWSAKKLQITYLKNGGSGDNQTQEVYYNQTFTTKDKIFSREHYNLIGWYQRLAEYDFIDCIYGVNYPGVTSTHFFEGYFSFKVDKAYSENDARQFCENHVDSFKNSHNYSWYVEWLKEDIASSLGTCKCSGNLDTIEKTAPDQSSCNSSCPPLYTGHYAKKCQCGNSEECKSKSTTNAEYTSDASKCNMYCSRNSCYSSNLINSCTCTPMQICSASDLRGVASSQCTSKCLEKGCKGTYEAEEYDETRVHIYVKHGMPSKRYEIREYNLNKPYTYIYTDNIELRADWQEKASCPAGTTMVAGAGTDNPTCCTNCASVSNGSCSVELGPNNTCKYNTSCNSGYTMVSGSGTNAPICCKSCPSISNGSCSVSWNGSSCVYTTSCNQGYKLSNNGTTSATCTRCEGWRLTNPNADVFDTIDKVQGQEWEYLNTSDEPLTGWINVHGDIYTNQVTTDSNGNGVCDTGNSKGWFYISKTTKKLRKGWVCENDKWYYLWTGMGTGDFRDYPSGELSGRLVVSVTDIDINGSNYTFDSSGVCTKGKNCDAKCSSYDSSYSLD